jgi:phosphoglycolate phosphatase-like HAD superfamily hydrolase
MTDFPFSIVGFDLDGTLCDTAADLGNALNRTLEHAGRPGSARRGAPLHRWRIGQMLRNALAESGGYDEASSAVAGPALCLLRRSDRGAFALYPGGRRCSMPWPRAA